MTNIKESQKVNPLPDLKVGASGEGSRKSVGSADSISNTPRPSSTAPKPWISGSNPIKRSPVLVVMGHVDHGKTTLLDYIRKTSVASREAGGITQSIGAYEIMHMRAQNNAEHTQTDAEKVPRSSASSQRESAPSEKKRMTFIDTPGHEAFSKMRARGAKIADIAILVVAADDGVKPQTKEAFKTIQEAKIPFIVAINKIDKPGIDLDKIKNDLIQAGIFLEGAGGNISWQAISAKTGQGVKELLDLILLTAELENLTCDLDNPPHGYILESKLESRRGIVATVILKDGILRLGDNIVTGEACGKIKILENFLGKKAAEIRPSSPALIVGFNSLPKIGEEFLAGQLDLEKISAREVMKKPIGAEMPMVSPEKKAALSVILKADVAGSLEVISEVIRNLPNKDDLKIEISDASVGDISDGDVKSAINYNAVIVGFKVKATKAAENLARIQNIKMIQSDIIYELIKALEENLASHKKESALGKLEVLAVFGKKKGRRQVIGGKVIAGEVKNNSALEIEREGKIVGQGKILNLQKEKKDIQKAEVGDECGILFDSEIEIRAGNVLILR